jgi:hypothetical protein
MNVKIIVSCTNFAKQKKCIKNVTQSMSTKSSILFFLKISRDFFHLLFTSFFALSFSPKFSQVIGTYK